MDFRRAYSDLSEYLPEANVRTYLPDPNIRTYLPDPTKYLPVDSLYEFAKSQRSICRKGIEDSDTYTTDDAINQCALNSNQSDIDCYYYKPKIKEKTIDDINVVNRCRTGVTLTGHDNKVNDMTVNDSEHWVKADLAAHEMIISRNLYKLVEDSFKILPEDSIEDTFEYEKYLSSKIELIFILLGDAADLGIDINEKIYDVERLRINESGEMELKAISESLKDILQAYILKYMRDLCLGEEDEKKKNYDKFVIYHERLISI